MRFGSVCSGIEAASVAWHPLGWTAAWLSEIEAFPSAVLAHHYPETPNLGDMTKIATRILAGEVEAPELLVGGTPCQAFSVAGLREGLADARGQLTIHYVGLANAIDLSRARRGDEPAVIVWENVPGVLSSRDNAFGCFLGALVGEDRELHPSGARWSDAGCVYGPQRAAAWRVLDAQYFGLAQRRRRVFVVASSRDGFDPAAVLFEREGVRRDSAPRREARKDVAPTISARPTGGGGLGTDFDLDGGLIPFARAGHGDYRHGLGTLQAQGGDCGAGSETLVAHSLRAEGFDASEDGTGLGTPLVPVGFSFKDSGNDAAENLSPTLRSLGAYDANGGSQMAASIGAAVRRLTPEECEALQGFPRRYTAIPYRGKPAADGPRYKALGNSMAVPCMAWIGRRISLVLGGAA